MNYTLLCDFYELTMGNGYFQTEGYADQICYFDVFFRSVPDGGGFAIAAGLEQVLSQLNRDTPERMEVLGCSHFAPLTDESLDPLRRLMTARGEVLGGEMS